MSHKGSRKAQASERELTSQENRQLRSFRNQWSGSIAETEETEGSRRIQGAYKRRNKIRT